MTPFAIRKRLLRLISAVASGHPIEIILLTFVVVTLTYFQLLHTIKHSDFFSESAISSSWAAPRSIVVAHGPAVSSSSPSGWSPLPLDDWRSIREGGSFLSPAASSDPAPARVVFVKQLVISLDPIDVVERSNLFAGQDFNAAATSSLVDDEDDEPSVRSASASPSTRSRPSLAAGAASNAARVARAGSDDIGLLDEQVQGALARFEDYVLTAASVPYRAPANLSSLPLLVKAVRQASALRNQHRRVREGHPLTFASDLCYVPTAANEANESACFHLTTLTQRTLILTLAFSGRPETLPASSALLPATAGSLPPASFARDFAARLAQLPTFSVDGLTVSSRSIDSEADATPSAAWGANSIVGGRRIGEMRSARWVAYAFVALVMRFWGLARQADSADVFVVLAGYLIMHLTFARLFLSMRRMGSNFWLPGTVLLSSCFAFLVALLAASVLGIQVDPVCLSEALPFLVITVGFDKPFALARAVFTSPEIAPVLLRRRPFIAPGDDEDEPARPARKDKVEWAPPVPARDIAVNAVSRVGPSIVHDYALEVAVLTVGAASGVGGLKEFCKLAALILVADCCFLFSFYVAILTIMVEVHRIKLIRGLRPIIGHRPTPVTSSPSTPTSSSASSSHIANGNASPVAAEPPVSFLRRVSRMLFGSSEVDTVPGGKTNPVARLKLLLIGAFLVLHILNLCTTLTETTAIRRHTTHQSTALAQQQQTFLSRRVDPASPSVAAVLGELAALHAGEKVNLIAHVAPPVHFGVSVPSMSISASKRAAATAARGVGRQTHHGLVLLDNFMTAWTALVGDPVLSKWIIVTMAVSIILNGYLLKGIASASASGSGTRGAGGAAAAAAAVLLGAWETDGPERELFIKAESASDTTPAAAVPVAAAPVVAPAPSVPEPPKYEKPMPAFIVSPATSKTIRAAPASAPVVAATSPSIAVARPDVASDRPALDGLVNGNGPVALPTDVVARLRPLEECAEILKGGLGPWELEDEEVVLMVQKGKIAPYALEKVLQDCERAVKIRRAVVSRASVTKSLEASDLPYIGYDYAKVLGACCENVVGYMPLPVGIAGPLTVDGESLPLPMATTEGTLVASTSRGCKALNAGGGVTTVITQDAMTRGPAVEFPSVTMAAQAKRWLDSEEGLTIIKEAFDSTSRFARLQSIKCGMAGRTLYIRLATSTGDAMGMNMAGKATEKCLEAMNEHFPHMQILALSGNYCTDKKPAAINWVEGRGKSVVAEAVISGAIVKSVLKTTVGDLVNLNQKKNLIGSAMAGSIGGFNAHASNILTSIFLATGQDPAQNVESSMCMTLMESVNDGQDLLITVSMPCIEVGTVGGGTFLPPQNACLQMLGVAGAHPDSPGHNARRLARVIAASVMAGELSLMSALAAGHLIKAHMTHNRSTPNTPLLASPLASRPTTPSPHPRTLGLLTPMASTSSVASIFSKGGLTHSSSTTEVSSATAEGTTTVDR